MFFFFIKQLRITHLLFQEIHHSFVNNLMKCKISLDSVVCMPKTNYPNESQLTSNQANKYDLPRFSAAAKGVQQ